MNDPNEFPFFKPQFIPDDVGVPQEALLTTLKDGAWHQGSHLREKGGHNYTARIGELRDQGHEIETSKTHGPDGFARYRWLGFHPSTAPITARVDFTFDELTALIAEGKTLPSVKAKIAKAYATCQRKAKQRAKAIPKSQMMQAPDLSILDLD